MELPIMLSSMRLAFGFRGLSEQHEAKPPWCAIFKKLDY